MAEESKRIHLKLLTDIVDLIDTTSTDCEKFITHVGRFLAEGELARNPTLLDKLKAMQTKRYLGVGNYGNLKQVAEDSGNMDVHELIIKAEKEILKINFGLLGDHTDVNVASTSEYIPREKIDREKLKGSKKKDEAIKVITKTTKRKSKEIEEKNEHSTKNAKRDLTTPKETEEAYMKEKNGSKKKDEAIKVITKTTKRKSKEIEEKNEHSTKNAKRDLTTPKETEEAYMKEKNDLQTDLITLYNESYLKTAVAPLTPDDDAQIEALYVKPDMRRVDIQQETKGDKEQQTPKVDMSHQKGESVQGKSVDSYKDIFYKDSQQESKDKQQNKKIYITGDAGTGKTTLCKKMILTWCKAHSKHASADSLSEDEQVMLNFQFLFYISLRNATSDSNIEDMIKNQLVQSNLQHPLLSTVLQKKSEKCLILLDGLDEWTPPEGYRQMSPVINKGLPNRTVMNKWTIVTTSRPWKLEVLRLESSEIDHQIELKGIDSKSADELIKSTVDILNTNHGRDMDSKQFLIKLNENDLKQFLYIPVILKQLIALWHEGKPLGTSQCDIYSSMIDLMFELAEKRLADTPGLKQLKEEWSKKSKKSNIQLPKCFVSKPECEQYKHLLYSLSTLSFKTLFSENPESSLVFESKVADIHGLSATEIEVSLKAGLLSQSKIKGCSSQMKSLSFLHKTFQEFLASMFVSMSSGTSDEFVKTICTTCNSKEKVFEMGNIFKFISGMSPQTATKLSEHICVVASHVASHVTSQSQYTLEQIQDLVVDCVNEGLDNGYMDIRLKQEYINFPYDLYGDNITYSGDKYARALKHLIGSNLGNIKSLDMKYYDCTRENLFIESLLLLTSVETVYSMDVDTVFLLSGMDNLRNTLNHLTIFVDDECMSDEEPEKQLSIMQPINNLKSLQLSHNIYPSLVKRLVDGAAQLTDIRIGDDDDAYYSVEEYDYDDYDRDSYSHSYSANMDLDLSRHEQLRYFIVKLMMSTTVTVSKLNTTNLLQCKIANCGDAETLLKCLIGAPKLETLWIHASYCGQESGEQLSTMEPMNNLKTIKLIDIESPSQIQCLVGCATHITDLHLEYTRQYKSFRSDESDTPPVNIALDLSLHKQLQHIIYKTETKITLTVAKLNTANLLECNIEKCRDPTSLLKCLSGAPKLQTLCVNNHGCDDIPREESEEQLPPMEPMNNLKTIKLIDVVSPSQIQCLVRCAPQVTDLHLQYNEYAIRVRARCQMWLEVIPSTSVQRNATNLLEIDNCRDPASLLKCLSFAPKLETLCINNSRCVYKPSDESEKQLYIQPMNSLKTVNLINVKSPSQIQCLLRYATQITELRLQYGQYGYVRSDESDTPPVNIALDLSLHEQLQHLIFISKTNITVTVAKLNTTNLLECKIDKCRDPASLLKWLSGAPKLQTLRIDNSRCDYTSIEKAPILETLPIDNSDCDYTSSEKSDIKLSVMAPMNNLKTIILIDIVSPSQIQYLLGCATQITYLHLEYNRPYTNVGCPENIAFDLLHWELQPLIFKSDNRQYRNVGSDGSATPPVNIALDLSHQEQLRRLIFKTETKITFTVAKLNTANLLECNIEKCRDPASLLKCLSGAPNLQTLRVDNHGCDDIPREESEEQLPPMEPVNNLKTIKLIDVVSSSQIQCLLRCATQLTDLCLEYKSVRSDESDTPPVNIALDLSLHEQLQHLIFKTETQITFTVAKLNTANLLVCNIEKCRDPASLLKCLSGAPKLQTLRVDNHGCDDIPREESEEQLPPMEPVNNLKTIKLIDIVSPSQIQCLLDCAPQETDIKIVYNEYAIRVATNCHEQRHPMLNMFSTFTVAKRDTTNLLGCEIDNCRDPASLLKCLSFAPKLQTLSFNNSRCDLASLLKCLSFATKLQKLRIDNSRCVYKPSDESEKQLYIQPMNNLKTVYLINVVSQSQIQCLLGCAKQITDLRLEYKSVRSDESDTPPVASSHYWKLQRPIYKSDNRQYKNVGSDESDTPPVNIVLDLSHNEQLKHLIFNSYTKITVTIAKLNTANILKCKIDKCCDTASLLKSLSGAPKLQTLRIGDYEDDYYDDEQFSDMLPITNLEKIKLTSHTNSISQRLIQWLVGSASKLTRLHLEHEGTNKRTSIPYLDLSHNEKLRELTIRRVCIAAVQLNTTNLWKCEITGCVCTLTSVLKSLSGASELIKLRLIGSGAATCDCNKNPQISDALSACLQPLVKVWSITLDFIIAKQVQLLFPEMKKLEYVYITECTMTSEEFRSFVDSIGHTQHPVVFELGDIRIISGEDTATTLEYMKSCPRFNVFRSRKDENKYTIMFST